MVFVRKKYDSLWLGILLGVIAPVFPFLGYYLINYSFMSINSFFRLLALYDTYTPLLSLCVIANLLVFFVFIWTHRYYSARGVLLSTFIYAAIVFFLKLS